MSYPNTFYEKRLAKASDPREAVWAADPEQWAAVKLESTTICTQYIHPGDRVLDAGCGIGELVECLPPNTDYYGIDYCGGFIQVARERYPDYRFAVCDLLDLSGFTDGSFDLVICRTVEGVLGEVWPGVLTELRRIGRRVLVFRARLLVGDTLETVKVFTE